VSERSGEDLVNRQLEHIVDEPRQQSFQNFAGFFEARICVRLNQPAVEV